MEGPAAQFQIRAFSNNSGFHARDGSGYRFVAGMIARLDPINPHSSSQLAGSFARWKDYEPKRRVFMHKALVDLVKRKNLSPNCHEIIAKSLAK